MRKLLIASLFLFSGQAFAACEDLHARWTQLTESGEWAAGTAMPLDTQARLFGEAKSLLLQMERRCGATARSRDLLRQFDGALEEIKAERQYRQDQANDHSMVCVGWEGFASCQ